MRFARTLFYRSTALLLAFILIASAALADGVNVCFYIVGGDLEADSGAASEDIKEIARADLPDGVQVYLLAGGTPEWRLDMIPDAATAFIKLEQGRLRVLETWPDVSVGDARALARCAARCREAGGAEHTAFVFWGHGADGSRGVGYDLCGGMDTLTLDEIAEGLAAGGLRPDIIGFDACAMATLESCWILADSCDYLVASTEPEALEGWRHHRWLSRLGDDMKGASAFMAADYNDECLRRGASAAMQAIDLKDFRARMKPCLDILFDACPAPIGRTALSAVAQGDEALADAVRGALGGADILIGKYQPEDLPEARTLEGIGDAYYRWLATK